MLTSCFVRVNEQYCKVALADDYDRKQSIKRDIGMLAIMTGRLPHEIFEDVDWYKTLYLDLDIMYAGLQEYIRLMRGNTGLSTIKAPFLTF